MPHSIDDADDFSNLLNEFRKRLIKEKNVCNREAESKQKQVSVAITIAIGLLAIGAVLATLPAQIANVNIDKWTVTAPISIAGAIYFIVNQLKLREWSDWNYWRADELDRILRMLDIESNVPPTPPDLIRVNKAYDSMVERLGKAANAITISFTNPPRVTH